MGTRILSTAHGTHRGSFAGVDWALFSVVGTIWGSSFLFMAIGLETFRPGLVTWLRILFGVAVLWVLPGVRTRIDRADLGPLLLLAVTWVAIPFTLFPLAQGSVNSAIAGMLNGAAPIFTAVVATILFRKAPGPRQLIGIPLGFLGVAAIALSAAGHGSSEALGVALILVATMCYGIAFNIAAPLQQKYGSLPVMARILAIGAVLTAPLGVVSIPGSGFAWSSLLAVAAVGVLGTGIAFVLMGRLVGRVGATRASIVGYLIPVVALLLGVLIRNDVVGPSAVAGVVLVIIGAFLTSRREVGDLTSRHEVVDLTSRREVGDV
jgi:drug/metabolite transporter (DMT)-like permease